MDYDRSALVREIGDTVVKHFLHLIPPKAEAVTVRALLLEAVRVSGMTAVSLLPGFRENPLQYLDEWDRDLEAKTDELMKIVMRPGSRYWRL